MGKVLVINTLSTSLFVYKMSALLNISNKQTKRFEEMINNYLWGIDKKHKIPLTVLTKSKQDRGLRLVDLKMKQNALKVQ